MNTKHNSIKCEYKISQSTIPFFDTEIYIKNKKLYTKICMKETDTNFLLINSEQLISLKNNIPYSPVLRAKRTCSAIETFNFIAQNLNKSLLRKGTNLTS